MSTTNRPDGLTDHQLLSSRRPPRRDRRDEEPAADSDGNEEDAGTGDPPVALLDDITTVDPSVAGPAASGVVDRTSTPGDDAPTDAGDGPEGTFASERGTPHDIVEQEMAHRWPITTAINDAVGSVNDAIDSMIDSVKAGIDKVGEVVESGMNSVWSGEETGGDTGDGGDEEDDGDGGDGGDTVEGGQLEGGSQGGQMMSAPGDPLDPIVEVDLGGRALGADDITAVDDALDLGDDLLDDGM